MKNVDKTQEIQEFELPIIIKEEIKNNIIKLKELLKDDQEFAKELIKSIVEYGVSIPAQTIENLVFQHYSNIIKQAQVEYKAWPKEIDNIRDIACNLSKFTSGYNHSIIKVLENAKVDYSNDDCIAFGRLAQIEIGKCYNSDIQYDYNTSLMGMLPEDLDF